MSELKRLPETVYVAWQDSVRPGDRFLANDTERARLVENDGPTLVGTYRLVKQEVLRKEVHSMPADPRKPGKARKKLGR